MRERDRNWLTTIRLATDSTGGMYPGLQADALPSGPAKRLRDAWYIELFVPHNPVHKDRWTITPTGRAALAEKASSIEPQVNDAHGDAPCKPQR
jgi:hypothetical protein